MKRRLAACVWMVVAAALLGGIRAQEPSRGDEPVRLKKKKKVVPAEKPETEPPAKKTELKEKKKIELEKEKTPPGTEPPDTDTDADANEREVLDRIARNIKTAEERLAQRELGDATRQVQEDVLKDIDALLKKANNPSEGGGSGANAPTPDQGNDGEQGQQGKSGSAGKSGQGKSGQSRPSSGRSLGLRQRKQFTRSASRGGGGQKKLGQGSTPPKAGQGTAKGKNEPNEVPNGNQPGAGTRGQEGNASRAADLYKDIWGHLPESLRQEMNAYFNDKQFMAKYDDLIKRYYSAIAEKGRPKAR